jgi:acyl carrier protein
MSVISPTEQPTPELIITPQQHQNQWLYEFPSSTLYLTTLETTGGRLKLTMQEQDTSTLYLKTYMCLLSMNELIELLKSVNDKIDYANEKSLVTGKVLDSIDITSIIVELEDHYDIEITMEYMENENFDSVEAMLKMIEELQD